MTRGNEGVHELTDVFTTCGLFSPDSTLQCIVTSAVASTFVTLDDDAQSIGMRILKGMMDLEVREYIFPVSSKATLLAARLEVEMNGEKVSVYPQPLFQHLSVATSTKTDGARQESFAYELCSEPPSLFDHKLFQCSGAKSELAGAIWRQVDSEHNENGLQ